MTAASLRASIVMVSYHTGPVLFRAIAGVLAQDTQIELILVDNGNTESALTHINTIAEKDGRLRVITGHGNVGFAKGCNLGAAAARGNFLLFLNPDCLISPHTVAQLEEEGSKIKRPYMLGARLLNENGSDQRGCRRSILTPTAAFIEVFCLGYLFPKMRLNRHLEKVPTNTTPIPAISGAFMFLHREDFWNVGGFDEGYFLHVDDLDFCLRFLRAGGVIYFVPQVIATHVGGTSETTTVFLEKHKARGFVRYFHKNFGDHYPKPLLWVFDLAIWARAVFKISIIAFKFPEPRVASIENVNEPQSISSQETSVSVVIPTYNRAQIVQRAIGSVLAQTYKDFELIVVNDASPDDTIQELAKIGDPRLKVITHEHNQGLAGAHNTGIKAARGKWVALLDDDDEWMSDKLERQLAYMQRANATASVTDYRLLTTKKRWIERKHSKLNDPDWLMLTGTGLSLGSTMIVRRNVFKKVGYFDPQDPDTGNRTDDWDWFLRFRRQFSLTIVPIPLTRYTGTHRRKYDMERKAVNYIWKKYAGSIRQEGASSYGTFRAAYTWKLARVDLNERLYGACFLKLMRVVLTRPLDAIKYARMVLADVLPWAGRKNEVL